MMNLLLQAVQAVNSCLSDYVLTVLLVGTGLFFTIRTRLVQRYCLGKGMRQALGDFSLHGRQNGHGLNPFQALCAAVAAQVGTGNIVGASGAILTGGPGAIFWMWLIAFFGMATIYAEAILAQVTRIQDPSGELHGGPVYYIKRAFPGLLGTALAYFFAIACVLSLGFIGGMVQANSISETCHNAFGLPPPLVGFLVALLSFLIFTGGISRISRVTEKLVPLMALLYLLGGLLILVLRWKTLPATFASIFQYAFNPEALIGGGMGYALKTAISQGVKRGLFSNEAGMGSTPHAHAQAIVDKPHDQGVVAMCGVFVDTFVVLTMTALVVISTLYCGDGPLAGATGETYSQLLASQGLTKTTLVQTAFSHALAGENLGEAFVAICLFFFAFSTILGWNFFGKINFHYLFGKKALPVYYILAAGFIFLGSIVQNDLAWELQDMFNQLMVLPNVMALLALSSLVAKAKREASPQ